MINLLTNRKKGLSYEATEAQIGAFYKTRYEAGTLWVWISLYMREYKGNDAKILVWGVKCMDRILRLSSEMINEIPTVLEFAWGCSWMNVTFFSNFLIHLDFFSLQMTFRKMGSLFWPCSFGRLASTLYW